MTRTRVVRPDSWGERCASPVKASFRQEHLASAEGSERRRAHWRRVKDRIAAALDRQ
ncbi:hypothetical protein ACH4PU_14240 [Streptomyces sp. NPDC021100]|uniref:hypothetical protein n=1 Tax=Streptomyces sp. NPDC021100 TaxID=3365114 RepID=UPI0037AFDA91